VTVTDTGIGMSAESLDTVFDMFVQVDEQNNCAKAGLGIGLTLVRSLVEMHGGRIDGYEVASRIRARPADHLVKPPAIDDLRAVLTTSAAILSSTNNPIAPAPSTNPNTHELHRRVQAAQSGGRARP
jgi:hypothetical protein